MAVDQIRFQVLDVGQGTGNFIEIYDGTQIVNTILLDLGSESKKKAAGFPSAAYIVTALKSMQPTPKYPNLKPTIDTVILSHSDSDHINLIEQVLSAFHPPGEGDPELTINFVRYGGDFGLYKKGKQKNVISRLEQFAGDDNVDSVSDSYTDFNLGNKSTPMRTVDGVDLFVVTGNTPVTSAKKTTKKRKAEDLDGYAINTMSIVVVASYTGVQFVATGDATGQTLSSCNDNLTEEIRKAFLPLVFMVTLPHHGSRTTTFDLKGLGDEAAAKKNLERFVERVNAKTITGSAERKRTFKHPSAEVMSYFWPTLDPTPRWKSPLPGGYHFYAAYFTRHQFSYLDGTDVELWPTWEWWHCVQALANVYTNLYFDYDLQAFAATSAGSDYCVALPPSGKAPVDAVAKADPNTTPLGVAWTFGVTNMKIAWVDWIINRPALAALQAAIDAEVPPEEMPEADHLHQPIPDEAFGADELLLGTGPPEPLVPGMAPVFEQPEPSRAEPPGPAPGFERIRRLT